MAYRRPQRTYRRRRRNVARRHPLMKAVAKTVVKRALSRTVERKNSLQLFADEQLKSTIAYFYNPMKFIVKGEQPTQRVGDKLSNVSMDLALSYWHEGIPYGSATDSEWAGSTLRVLVVKTPLRVSTGSTLVWNQSLPGAAVMKNLFHNEFQGSFSPVNRYDYQVLFDRTVSSHKNYYTSYPSFGTPGQLRVRIPLAKQFRYTSIGTEGEFSTQHNIYVIVTVSGVGSDDTDKMGRLQFSTNVSWTDA